LRTRVRILIAVATALTGALALAATASADLLSPESGGSGNADAIDNLYWIVFVMAMIVLIGVWATLLYSMIKFRARRGSVPAQIRGNTRLEIGWTVGAALLLVVIAVVTFIQLDDIRSAPESSRNGLALAAQPVPEDLKASDPDAFPKSGKSLRVQVTGLQYAWRFSYLDGDGNTLNDPFDYTELVLPTDTTVTLLIRSQDVIHSWWIPEFGGKFDAVPGHTNYTWIKIPGRLAGRKFRGQCAELCGRNHANMVAFVRALSPQDWRAYINRRKQEIAQANKDAAAQRRRIENPR
jgi:cytochrome c oxidase subunit 2